MNVGMVTVDKGDIGIPVSDGWGIRVVMEKYKCCIVDHSMLDVLSIDDTFIEPHPKWGSKHSWAKPFLTC
jgi:hypothetical protein